MLLLCALVWYGSDGDKLLSKVLLHDLYVQGGYEHYMQKEIHEQPEALTQTMRGRVAVEQTKEVSETCWFCTCIDPARSICTLILRELCIHVIHAREDQNDSA